MNRCRLGPRRGPSILFLLLSLGVCAGLPPAWGQTGARIPPIAATAVPGTLRVVQPPEALLDGQPARLAPGVRIRGRNNLLLLSAALVGQELPVRYTRDPLGLLREVWVLTDAEQQATAAQRR